jgi:hypothetical protein
MMAAIRLANTATDVDADEDVIVVHVATISNSLRRQWRL